MIYRKIIIVFAGIMAFVLYSCKDNSTLVGAGLLKNDYLHVKQLDSYADSLHQTSTYIKKVIPLGASSYLFVGKADNVQASALVKYAFYLPDSILTDLNDNAASVIYANIVFHSAYTFGDSNAAFDFSVHKVNSLWTQTGFDADSSLNLDPSDVSSNHQISDSLVSADISNSLVTNWLKEISDSTYSSDYGICLSPSNGTQKVVGFEILNSSLTAASSLQIVLQKPGVYTDTLLFYPLQNTSIVSGNLPTAVKGDMFVQSGLLINSKLWFDVSSIPKNATINNAELTLTRDTVATITGSPYTNSLIVYILADSTTDVLSDSTNVFALTGSGNIFQGSITTFVQSWVDKGNNQGLLIRTYSPVNGLELFAIKNSSASDLSVRPRLQITYTINK